MLRDRSSTGILFSSVSQTVGMADGSTDRTYSGITSLLVLGVGLTALFFDVENWWVIFVIGYAVVLPIVAILTDEDGDGDWHADHTDASTRSNADEPESTDDALETLRERYATGELSEAQFERKLERLLETETPEDARERVTAEGRVATESETAGTESETAGTESETAGTESETAGTESETAGTESETAASTESASDRGRERERERERE
jgi:uncharacterized membrane protein